MGESGSTPESDALSEEEIKNWRGLRRRMFMDVVHLLCLNLGCLQRRLEHFLSSGVLDRFPGIGDNDKCGQSCPVCCSRGRQWGKIYRKVSRPALVEWFESEEVEKVMPLVAEYNNNGDSLTNLLWSEDDKLIYRIFGVMKH